MDYAPTTRRSPLQPNPACLSRPQAHRSRSTRASTVYVIPIAPHDRQTVEVRCERDQITGRGGGAW